MTDSANGNGENTTNPSGGTSSKFSGKKPTDQPALGAIESFKGLVFKYNTRDQVDMYNRTTERLIEYVTVEYGSDMKNLVKYHKERVFTEPMPPAEIIPGETKRAKRGATETETEFSQGDLLKSEIAMVRYKELINNFMKEQREYKDQKAKVFGVVLGQCTREVKSKLGSDPTFATIEQENNIIGLLGLLKVMSHSTAGVQEPYWAMQNQLRLIIAMNQGPYETVSNYHDRFKGQAEVITGQWGDFYPSKLAASTSTTDKKASSDKLLTMIFLAGACKKRFGNLKMSLNNEYLAGKDNYPATLQAAMNLLTHYQDNQANDRPKHGSSDSTRHTSFAQSDQSSKKSKKKAGQTRSTTRGEPNQNNSRARSRSPPSRSASEGWSAN